MRQSMARLTPRFSANRAIREYTEKYYLPAARRYRHRTENRAALAIELVEVQHRIDDHWQGIYFGKLECKNSDSVHHFRLQVYLDDLASDAVKIEMFADEADGLPAERYPMTRGERLVGAKAGCSPPTSCRRVPRSISRREPLRTIPNWRFRSNARRSSGSADPATCMRAKRGLAAASCGLN